MVGECVEIYHLPFPWSSVAVAGLPRWSCWKAGEQNTRQLERQCMSATGKPPHGCGAVTPPLECSCLGVPVPS